VTINMNITGKRESR